jgi:hypothetical protein
LYREVIVPRDDRRRIRAPNNRNLKKVSTNFSWNKYQSDQKMLYTLEEVIDEWAPRNWSNEHPSIRIAKINNSGLRIESLINKLANRSIHCRIIPNEDHFLCTFIGNGEDSNTRMRAMIDDILNQERTKSERETGFFETNDERKIRLAKEKIAAEEEIKRLEYGAMLAEMRNNFRSNPLARFDHIKELGDLYNFQTTYVIELNKSVISSNFEPAYPSKHFPVNDLHSQDSRCFYVGMTWHNMEERFHTANANHMWNKNGGYKIGAVRKHRLIEDSEPFVKSIVSLHKLTSEYGYQNDQRINRVKSDKFEHYVAYTLYMCGFRTWGPKFSDLSANLADMSWLGEYPFL